MNDLPLLCFSHLFAKNPVLTDALPQVSMALQDRELNRQIPLWVEAGAPEVPFGSRPDFGRHRAVLVTRLEKSKLRMMALHARLTCLAALSATRK